MSVEDRTIVPQGVHLVGSTGFKSREEHFSEVGKHLGQHIRSVADGEIQPRLRGWWAACQVYAFEQNAPELLQKRDHSIMKNPDVHLDESADLNLVSIFENAQLGYDKWAMDSYAHFKQLRADGVIPAHVKFQVGMPTALSACEFVLDFRHRAAAEHLYAAALARTLRNIQDHVPHDDLVIQFECVATFFFLEEAWKKPNAYGVGQAWAPWFGDGSAESIQRGVFERLVKWTNEAHIDDDVELGFHLCYGNSANKHFLEPENTGYLASVAEQLLSGVKRRINYIQMPVPKSRDDEAYLQPLKAIWPLLQDKGTYLYLGLVHPKDESGTNKRTETAKKVLGDYGWGVSTECGLGRTPELVDALESLAKAARPWH